jgi:murein DD-endopeptidase MepM/ murein hydrolase activator NlpD
MECVLNFIARVLLAVAFLRVFVSEGHCAESERPVVQATSQSTPTSAKQHALQVVAPSITAGNISTAAPESQPQPGFLLIPVAGINTGQLSDTFIQARGDGRSHEAIDIVAPRGTLVFAVDDGTIAKLFNSEPGGLTVYQFDLGEKFAYFYGHLDSYAPGLTEGQHLKRGEMVGYVGSSGNANPVAPHLHFAIFVLGPEKDWWQGTPINPYPLLTVLHLSWKWTFNPFVLKTYEDPCYIASSLLYCRRDLVFSFSILEPLPVSCPIL